MSACDFHVSWMPTRDRNRLFWCQGVTPEFIAWLRRRPLEVYVVYHAAEEWVISRDTVLWIFRDPRDAYWCTLRFAALKRDYFPQYYFASWDDDEVGAGWLDEDDEWPVSEEMTWERSVGSLNLGSTGGCPMWQEGPRPRPIARPRRDAH